LPRQYACEAEKRVFHLVVPAPHRSAGINVHCHYNELWISSQLLSMYGVNASYPGGALLMRHLKQQGLLAFGILVALLTLAGCGSPPDSFTIAAAPASVVLANYGPAQALTITVTAVNGFKNPVNVAITGLPSGVKASPASLTMLPGTLQQVMLSSQTAAVVTTPNVQITGTSGTLTEANTASIQVTEAQTTAALNNAQFGFGNNIAGNVL